jgi:hypothetical protein
MYAPRSLASRRAQCACCASRGTRHRHHDGSHTQQRRTCAISALPPDQGQEKLTACWKLSVGRGCRSGQGDRSLGLSEMALRRIVRKVRGREQAECEHAMVLRREDERARNVALPKRCRGESCAELQTEMDGKEKDDGRVGRGLGNVPFEFVGEVARAGAVAEAGDVERGTTAARHAVMEMWCLVVA